MSDPFLEKPLPQNLEAERSVLGSILVDNALCDQAASSLHPSHFFLQTHQRLFDRMVTLWTQEQPIDIVTLTDAGDVEQLGGIAYIADLISNAVRGENIPYYADRIRAKAALRRIIATSSEAIARAFDADDPVEVKDRAVGALMDIEASAAGTSDALVDSLGCTGLDLDNDETEPVRWIAYGYVALGALSEVIAKIKAGKTTFIMALIRACLFGGDFLGHYVEPCKVLIVTEQGRVSFKAQARKAGINGSENLIVIYKYELTPFAWEQRVDLVMKKAAKTGAQVVIWDTFSRLA